MLFNAAISVLGVLLTLLAAYAIAKRIHLSRTLAILLTLWHTLACSAYYQFTESAGADADEYFDRAVDNDFELFPGTNAVIAFTKLFASDLAFSKFNTFLVFNFVGLAGLLLLARCLTQIWPRQNNDPASQGVVYLLLFLPGLSFWTSAIGKDAPAFLAACMMVYALVAIERRKFILAASIVLMFLVRPHIAALMIVAIGFALMFAARMRSYVRLGLLAAAAAATVAAIPFALSYAGLASDASLADILAYMEDRESANQGGGSSIDLTVMTLPEAIFSYLFRPLFFDAAGPLEALASVENLLYLIVFFAYNLPNFRAIWLSAEMAARANVAFVLVSLFLLAPITANLGIAMRQKTMILPSLLVLTAMGARASHARRLERALATPPARSAAVERTIP